MALRAPTWVRSGVAASALNWSVASSVGGVLGPRRAVRRGFGMDNPVSPCLWCVGDAVKSYGNGGTQACAETAKIAVDRLLAARRQPA